MTTAIKLRLERERERETTRVPGWESGNLQNLSAYIPAGGAHNSKETLLAPQPSIMPTPQPEFLLLIIWFV